MQASYFPDTVPAGSVTLICVLGLDMRFRDCRVGEETPLGYGLAVYAAKMLMAEARAQPRMVNGVAVPDEVVSYQVKVAMGARRAAAMAAASARVVPPSLRVRPPKDTMDRYFPSRAAASGIPGEARISCLVDRYGATQSCSIQSEKPEGKGFGEAAVHLFMKEAQFNPQTVNGRPVDGGSIAVRVVFTLPK